MRILLIEDDSLIGDGLKAGLEHMGFAVDWLSDGKLGRTALASAPFDAAILDLGLPGVDGMSVLAAWRRQGDTVPVLILTARDGMADRISGLDMGADDYMVKPFVLEEVAARLRALIRRRHGWMQPMLSHGGVVLDPVARCAWLGDHPLDLTASELALLELLLSNKGRIFPRELIEQKLYAWDQEPESNSIAVFVHHLRKKLGSDFIRTLRGIGYTLGVAP